MNGEKYDMTDDEIVETMNKAAAEAREQDEPMSEEERIAYDLAAGYDPWEEERVIVTPELVHGENIPSSMEVREDFFSDGRSYMSELWCQELVTLVTYYFPVDEPPLGEIPNDERFIEDYLIANGKLIRGEEHHLAVHILDCDGDAVYTVSVAIGDDDETFCEAYL